MKAEQWQRAKPLLEEVIALDAEERSSFLDRMCEGDPEFRREMESLLSASERVGTGFLKTPAANLKPAIAYSSIRIGQHVGPYQMMEEIGHGGMGEVYRAVRSDGQYTKQVAIKMVQGGSGLLVERFRHERQILASLDHPNIARLLDGGTAENGVPYLVMELVEGTRIDDYCKQREPSMAERLQLFLQVFAAVQFAHQRLIIHRDIKPGNILVTSDGVPKLLDFGIAKILNTDEPNAAESTLTMFRLLTPQYASPEQIRGEAITTASDIYSLGVVLYELLTGRSPYPASETTPQEVARAACEFEPRKPSTVVRLTKGQKAANNSGAGRAVQIVPPAKTAKQLRGDLDNIVLMALRKEPQRRYASVEKFGDDIRRHLQKLPVAARKDTARYRASKFVIRHKAGVAAAAAVVLVLIAGFVITAREARIAQRRFNDVRDLSNSLIFDVHDSIKDLPGSTPARKIIVDRSLKYLNVLAQESAGDVGLQRELATAYERVGLVQGDYLENNLGDNEGTLASYRKALEIRKQVDAKSNDPNDHVALAQTHRFVANQQWAMGNLAGARDNINRAIAISEGLIKRQPYNIKALVELGFDHRVSVEIRYVGDRGENQKLDEDRRRALAADEIALKIAPEDIQILHAYALDLKNMAISLEPTDPRAALPYYEKGLEINRQLTQRSSDTRFVRSVAISYAEIADVHNDLGEFQQEADSNRKGLEIYQQLSQADPKNALVRQGLAIAYVNTASALARVGDLPTSLAYCIKGLEIMRVLVASAPTNAHQRYILAAMLVARGTILTKARLPEAALAEFENARSIYELLDKEGGGKRNEIAACTVKMGEVAAQAGNTKGAADYFRQALAIAEPLISSESTDLDLLYTAADAYSGLGRLSLKEAQRPSQTVAHRQREWENARLWYQLSVKSWGRIQHPNHSSPNGFQVGDPTIVAQELKLTEVALSPQK